MTINFNLLRSKLFLVGLVLLILNDHYFKLAYPNWVTGKLSDFAGLFVFPIFLSAVSEKSIRLNYILAALIFVIWKSPIVEPVITAGHAIGVPFHRTVDYPDYIALAILPFSYKYLSTIPSSGVTYKKLAINTLAFICFACLTSTTLAPNFAGEINKSYKFRTSESDLIMEIKKLNCELGTRLSDTGDSLYVLRNLIIENDSVIKNATFRIDDKGEHSVLTLHSIETFRSYPAFFTWRAKRRLLKVAERYFIEEIK